MRQYSSQPNIKPITPQVKTPLHIFIMHSGASLKICKNNCFLQDYIFSFSLAADCLLHRNPNPEAGQQLSFSDGIRVRIPDSCELLLLGSMG